MYIVGVLLLSIGLPISTFATHIVGGSINYRSLGSDQYEITVRVYRDCFNGAPGADFDDPASIGVFDRFGSLLMDLRVPYVRQDTVTNRPDACLVIPQDVCVHTTTYIDTVSLPIIEGGYRLVYQRCCRNVTINNLVKPLETGATYDILLTEEAMRLGNSSPVFKDWPPVYICADEPLNFDHSATDLDGDSLVYKLCMPIQGATFAKPKPQPPNPPPYDEVVLLEPTYTLDNLLGFGVPLAVDQQSGLMTVTPDLLGQYVVGVCVEEYDRETGILLSSVRRDFQYNVINCEPLRASFEAPDAVCDDFTVQFENRTPDADDFLWFFNSPDEIFTSTERNPSFTFPDTGTYTVELIVEPNTVCEERFTKEIFVQRNSLTADFRVDVLTCADSAFLYLVDQSMDSISAVAEWDWLIQPDDGDALTATGRFPVVKVPINTTGSIQLTATSINGCVSTFTSNYEAPGINLKTYLADTLMACIGDILFLNPNTPNDVQLDYTWVGPGLSDATSINPSITVQDGNTLYELTISGQDDNCIINHTVLVIGGAKPGLDFNAFSTCEGLNYRFENTSTNSSAIQWIIGNIDAPLATSTDESFDFSFPNAGDYEVYLIGMAGCTDTLKKDITVLSAGDLGADFSIQYEECAVNSVDVLFTAMNTSTDSIVKWEWTLEDNRSSTLQNPIFNFTESDTLSATLIIESLGGCRDSITKEIEVNLIEDIVAQLPDTVGLCNGLAQQLLPENDTNYSYEWTPATGLSDPNVPNPVFSIPGVYTVEISLPESATCRVQTEVVAALPNNINLNVDGGGVTCDPELELAASTSVDAQIDWYLNGDLVAMNRNIFTAILPGANTYTVVATDKFLCTDTVTVDVDLIGVNVEIPEKIAVCDGEPITASVTDLNVGDQLTYVWSPANLISSGQGTEAVSIDAPIGVSQVFVEINNQAGCSTTDSIDVVVIDPDNALSFSVEPFCDGLTVQFTNTSQKADRFLWNFGDPNNPDATSTEQNPSYTYSEIGTYSVYLTLADEVSCTDTVRTMITLTDTSSFVADFDATLVDCQPGAVTFQFDNQTNNSDPNLFYEYVFEDGKIFNDPDFEVRITEYGTQEVKLIVSSEEGCTDSISQMITFPVIALELRDTIGYCDPNGFVLNPGGNTAYEYQWADRPGINDLSAASPEVMPTETTTYVVTVTANGTGQCVLVDSVTVVVPDSLLQLDLPDEISACGPAVLSTMVQGAESLTWEDQEGNIIGTGASVTVEPATMATYFLKAIDQYGCEAIDSVKVINLGVNASIEPGAEVNVCEQQEVLIQVENLDENDTLTYQWIPAELILADGDMAMPTLNPLGQGSYELSVIVSNQFACSDTLMITVNVGDLVSDLPDQVLVCGEDAIALSPEANTSLVYQWFPETGLDDPRSSNPIFSGTTNTTYIVNVSDPLGGPTCQTVDTVDVIIGSPVTITPEAAPDTACVGTSLTLMANSSSTINWYSGEERTNLNVEGSQLDITVVKGEQLYFAVASEPGGCTDTARFLINGIEIEDLGFQSPLMGCIGETFDLVSEVNTGFTYQWAPANLLEDATVPTPRTLPLAEDVTFRVTVTLPEAGCTLEGEVMVDVKDDIILEISEDTTTCPQTTVDLEVNVEPGATFTWFDANGNALGQTSPLSVGVDTSDVVITLVATDSVGCEQSQEVTINVTKLDAGLDTPVEICADDPTGINPDGNSSYQYNWSPTEGLDLSDPSNPIATLSSSQTFAVTVTDPATSCVLMTEVEVIVLENIIITSHSNDTTICTDDPLRLSATTNIPTTLQWFDDAAMTNLIGTGNSIEVQPVDGTNLYYVKTTDENCVDENDQAVVEVTKGNAVEITPEEYPDTACVGAMLTLEANAPSGTINWYQGAGFTDLNTSGNQLGVNIARGENLYYAIVREEGGCTDTARFSILGIQIEDLDLESPLTGCIDDVFNLYPGANTGFTYQWAPANLLEDATAPNPRTLPLTADVSFQVTITLPEAGCTLEGEVMVDVKDDIIIEISEDTTICPQTSVMLELELEPGATVTWQDQDGNVLGQSTSIEVQVDTTDLIITAIARDTTGCEQRKEVNITVDALEGVGLEGGGLGTDGSKLPIQACENTPTELNPNGNPAYQYTWSPADLLDLTNPWNPTATLDSSQLFLVTVTDTATNCTYMDSILVEVIEDIQITATSNDTMICNPVELSLFATTNLPTTLEWFDDAAMTNSIGNGENIQVLPNPGTNIYYVKTGDENCFDENDVDTIRVDVVDFDMVAPDTLLDDICKGDLLMLNPRGDDRFTYMWSPAENLSDPNSPNPSYMANMDEDFMVTITSPDGMCSTTRSVKVRLNNPINLDAGPDSTLCTTGTFKLRATGENPQNVMWSDDPTFTNIISTDLELEIDLVAGGQFYYVKADNGTCPAEVDSVFVGSELVNASLDDITLVCDADEGAVLTVQNNSPDQELEYLWMPDGSFASDPTAGPTATLNPGVEGTVTVLLENQFGCTTELTSEVEIQDIGDATIEASTTTIQAGNPVELTVNGCVDCTYDWSPPESVDNPNDQTVTVVPLETTTYSVIVRKGECERELTITIETTGIVCSPDNVFIPKAFTPNGDGINDVLFVRSNVIETFHLIIYNRWGQEVFDTRDINVGWDGTFRNRALPPDVYGYFLEVNCIGGGTISLQGNVTLLR